MKLKKIKTVSVLEFVPPCHLMLVKRSKDLQYIDTPEPTTHAKLLFNPMQISDLSPVLP